MIPAPQPVPFRFNEALLPIGSMDAWGQRTFHVHQGVLSASANAADPHFAQAYKTLNRLQSIVFPVAYSTNENMLVCAPTGAVSASVSALRRAGANLGLDCTG